MKDRIRECTFNLIGPSIRGKHAIDLFAGTGALGLEALSRGARSTTLIERHLPTSRLIQQNISSLSAEDRAQVTCASAFVWCRRDLPDLDATQSPTPWVVFFSPPYDFYVDQRSRMLDLIERMIAQAPAESIFIVEADDRFCFSTLPQPEQWDVRTYRPAVLGLLRQ